MKRSHVSLWIPEHFEVSLPLARSNMSCVVRAPQDQEAEFSATPSSRALSCWPGQPWAASHQSLPWAPLPWRIVIRPQFMGVKSLQGSWRPTMGNNREAFVHFWRSVTPWDSWWSGHLHPQWWPGLCFWITAVHISDHIAFLLNSDQWGSWLCLCVFGTQTPCVSGTDQYFLNMCVTPKVHYSNISSPFLPCYHDFKLPSGRISHVTWLDQEVFPV